MALGPDENRAGASIVDAEMRQLVVVAGRTLREQRDIPVHNPECIDGPPVPRLLLYQISGKQRPETLQNIENACVLLIREFIPKLRRDAIGRQSSCGQVCQE